MGTEHFDKHAATWDDDPAKGERARQIASAIAAAIPLSARTRVLEYGAGTGQVSHELAAHVGAMTLADNSAGMRSVIEQKIAAGTLPPGTRVWDLDLEIQSAPAERFDLIVTSMVLHHVHDLDAVLAGFAAMLEAGGHVAIADLDTEDGSFHAHTHDFDGHSGFDRHELARLLQRSGFTGAHVADCTEIEKDGVVFPVFLAIAKSAVLSNDVE